MTLENLLRIGKLKAHAADEREIARLLESYRKARNQSDYRGVPVSDAVAGECVADARRLLADVRALPYDSLRYRAPRR